MGSLVELKKEIEESEEALVKVANVVFDLEQELEFENRVLVQCQTHLKKLKFALSVLEGESLPEPKADGLVTSPPSTGPTPPQAPTRTIDLSPVCDGCGKGRMRPAVTRAPSGVYINMLRCDDGACNNEVYSA